VGIKSVEAEGYEADDLIATAVSQLSPHFRVVVVTGDKDLMQLVSDERGVTMLDTMKNIEYLDADVMEKFGVRPDQIVEYLALVGDSSDNIPGVNGIGPKSAVELLQKHASVDEIYKNIDSIPLKLRTKLQAMPDRAILSHKLVSFMACPIALTPEGVEFSPIENHKIFDLFDRLEFTNIRGDVEKLWKSYK
jgi:DNA polymerase-1